MILLMLIGGSPRFYGRRHENHNNRSSVFFRLIRVPKKEHAHFFRRRIPEDTIRSAAIILLLYLVLFLSGGMLICRIEGVPLISALFETASAIGTVGLSLGITPELGPISRVILITLMFFGRVGGLTLIFAALSETHDGGAKYQRKNNGRIMTQRSNFYEINFVDRSRKIRQTHCNEAG